MKKTWYDALLHCRSISSVLLEKEKYEEIQVVIKASRRREGLWIGDHNRVKEGHYIWESTYDPVQRRFWYKGEPNDKSGRENCVEMYTRYGGKFNDVRRETSKNYVCKKKNSFSS